MIASAVGGGFHNTVYPASSVTIPSNSASGAALGSSLSVPPVHTGSQSQTSLPFSPLVSPTPASNYQTQSASSVNEDLLTVIERKLAHYSSSSDLDPEGS